MPKYIVNIDKGYEGRPFGEAFESEEKKHAAAADSGYLIVADEPASPIVADPATEDRNFTREAKATTLKK